MHLLITAGPTREPIDAVRFISNRSSGKMGYAVASAALQRGHSVTLVSGPVSIKPPAGVKLIKTETAREMLTAVKKNVKNCDALIMAAAVADWRPAVSSSLKIKKEKMPCQLVLKKNPDILKTLAASKGDRIFIGFAAETSDFARNPWRKLRQKKLDMIVANNVNRPGSGFDTDTNQVTFYFADGRRRHLPLMPKFKVAERIIAWLETKKNIPTFCRMLEY
jgi:phosphopantothenoylcysteine decarboxylase/phosphopantothenate--cysteine ligase